MRLVWQWYWRTLGEFWGGMTPQKRRTLVFILLVGFGVPIAIAVALRLAPGIGIALLAAVLVLSVGSNTVLAVVRARRKRR